MAKTNSANWIVVQNNNSSYDDDANNKCEKVVNTLKPRSNQIERKGKN